MTALLSPVSLPHAAHEPRTFAAIGQGVSATSRASATETAQAARPVEPVTHTLDVRAETARDKPVGPPPAFEINVLQDMRRRAATEPIDDEKPPAEDEAEAEAPDAPPAQAEVSGASDRATAYHSTDNTLDPTVNRKV